MYIDDTVSKYYKTNYKTNSFEVNKTFGYNNADVVKTVHALDLDIFTPYALNIPPITK